MKIDQHVQHGSGITSRLAPKHLGAVSHYPSGRGLDDADSSDRWAANGWWFLPAAFIGLLMWILIIRALIGWLA